MVESFDELETLVVAYCNIEDANLAHIDGLTRLRTLALGMPTIGD